MCVLLICTEQRCHRSHGLETALAAAQTAALHSGLSEQEPLKATVSAITVLEVTSTSALKLSI